MKIFLNKKEEGFTLIELLLAVALFSIVVVIAFGAIIHVIDVNRKSQTLTTVMNDLNFTLESITRTIKTTTNIDGVDGLYRFKDQRKNPSNYVIYRFNDSNKKIEKCELPNPVDCSDSNFVPIVSDQIIIDEFYLEPLNRADGNQPRFLMVVKGSAQITTKIKSEFSLQTTVSPRIVDFADTLTF